MTFQHQDGSSALVVSQLGLRSFAEVWELQRSMQQQLIRGEIPNTLLMCEHRPVITAGTSTKDTSLLTSAEALASAGIDYFKIERGGDITYHGPGQIVAYPIINLTEKKRDVHWYMRSLEEVVLGTLKHFSLHAQQISGKTGVWIQEVENTAKNHAARKVASIGVRISRWCTMHGFALNVRSQTDGFRHIHPCGFSDIIVTSMEEERIHQRISRDEPFTVAEVTPVVVTTFCELFGYTAQQ